MPTIDEFLRSLADPQPGFSAVIPPAMLAAMAIQFQCPACREPIEIDGEWAGKLVACPYCRKAVTAPLESTYVVGHVPAARPVARREGFEAVSAAEASPVPYDGRPLAGNAAAVWAVLLASASLFCLILALKTIAAHAEELKPFMDMQLIEGKSATEVSQALMDHFQGAPPGWVMLLAVCMFLTLLFWLIGLICGLIGVRRRARRKLAITSLVLSTLVPAFFLLSMFAPRA